MGDPDLVWTVGDGIAGEVGEDESVVIAVGCSHEPPTPLGLRVEIAHDTADFLGIHDKSPMT